MMMSAYQKLHQEEEAELCAEKIGELVEMFCYWDYAKYAADLQMGIHQKDKERTLSALRGMFKSMNNTMDDMRGTLVKACRQENGLDGEGFLSGDEELLAILDAQDVL